jgi:hypothetical protein
MLTHVTNSARKMHRGSRNSLAEKLNLSKSQSKNVQNQLSSVRRTPRTRMPRPSQK